MIQVFHTFTSHGETKLTPELKAAFRLKAHSFALFCASGFLKVDRKDLKLSHRPTGRPYIKGFEQISFSLSHSDTAASVAISESHNVGLDTQLQRDFNEKLFARICTPYELTQLSSHNKDTFYNLWTLKEAVMKCIGLGFHCPMNQIEFHADSHSLRLLNTQEYDMPLHYPWSQFKYEKLQVPESYMSSLVWAANDSTPKVQSRILHEKDWT